MQLPESEPAQVSVVVDANILMSLLISEGSKRQLFFSKHVRPFSPDSVLFEIGKYWRETISKSGLPEDELKLVLLMVREHLTITSLQELGGWLKEAEKIVPDKDDAEYFALALKLNCPIWSEDRLLKNQSRVKVLNTPELLAELGLR